MTSAPAFRLVFTARRINRESGWFSCRSSSSVRLRLTDINHDFSPTCVVNLFRNSGGSEPNDREERVKKIADDAEVHLKCTIYAERTPDAPQMHPRKLAVMPPAGKRCKGKALG